MEPAPSIVPLAVPLLKGRTVTAMDFRNQGGVKCYTYNDNGKYYLVLFKGEVWRYKNEYNLYEMFGIDDSSKQ